MSIKVVKFTPNSNTLAQMLSGETYECLMKDGVLFVPMGNLQISGGSVEEGGDEEEEEPAKSAPVEKAPPKRTRKKKVEVEDADDVEEDEEPAKKSTKKAGKKASEEVDENREAVIQILEQLDQGEITAAKARTKVINLLDCDEDVIAPLITKFAKDETNVIETADAILAAVNGEAKEEDEEEEKPKRKRAAKKTAKKEDELPDPENAPEGGTLISDLSELEVGDEVCVYWNTDDVVGWFDGEVSKIKAGVVTVDYNDGSSEIIDEDAHTHIIKF